METQTETGKVEFPQEVQNYINDKVTTNASGGRPHFLKQISEQADAKDTLLEILERIWLKNKSIGSVARKFGTTYQTIYRMLQDLEPWKPALVQFMELVPRRKVFWNRDLNSSDYEPVQAFIRRAKRDDVHSFKRSLRDAMKCWKFLKYKDPSRWTAENILDFLATKTEGSQSHYLDCIRQVAPQIADKFSPHYISTGRFREKLQLRKKDLFSTEINMMVHALKEVGLTYHATIFEFHITGGFREGTGQKAGITGISWDRFKKNFTRVDDYESKVRGGIWCRNCPVDLFWKSLPGDLRKIWIDRGKPITDKVIMGGYPELRKIYKEISQALAEYFKDKVEPSLYKEITSLRPHDADKIHCNLLWEAEVPIEVVAGQFLGRGEGVGLMGRIWLSTDTIKKHYLSLTQRSERFQKIMVGVNQYSQRFNGGH